MFKDLVKAGENNLKKRSPNISLTSMPKTKNYIKLVMYLNDI